MAVRRRKPSSLKSKKAHASMMTPKAAPMSARRTKLEPLSFLVNLESSIPGLFEQKNWSILTGGSPRNMRRLPSTVQNG